MLLCQVACGVAFGVDLDWSMENFVLSHGLQGLTSGRSLRPEQGQGCFAG